MKRFLIITHAFPPFGGGGVQRMVKFATYLKREGWEATVVCPDQKNDSWLDFERLKEIGAIETIRIGYRNIKDDPFLLRVVRKFFPIDSYLGWALEVVKNLKKKDLSQYDIVFTSSPPSSTHLVGLLLAKSHALKWVADFRDHYTLGPEYKARGINRIIDNKFEKRIFQAASAIILNTATNKDEILENLGRVDVGKIHVIYNGFDYADLKESETSLNWQRDNLKHYLYLGGLRGDRIDGAFYRTLSAALAKEPSLRNEIKVQVVGDHSRKGNMPETLEISDVVEFADPVAYNRVGDYLEAADGCLTWQRPERKYRGTVAGKFFDYIGMKKPVFSLGQDDGEIAKILNKYQIGISADPENIDEAANKFLEFHQKVKDGLLVYTDVDSSFLNKFNRIEQSKQLARVFNSLV